MKKTLLFLLMVLFASVGYSQSCTPSFTVSQSNPYANHLTQAQISISIPPINYLRVFEVHWGDGQVSNSTMFPISHHDYASAGTYTVKVILKLTDSAQSTIYCVDSSSQNVTITYSPCATTLAASVNSQNNGQVTFTANTPANTSNMTYIWQYGDGTADTTTNTSVTHTYGYSGNFQVTLIASNGSCSYTNIYTVTVLNGCGQANFSYTTNQLTATFSNTSSYINTYPNRNSSWDFGDGSTSTNTNTIHTYNSAGTYNVSLITTWIDSANAQSICSDTITKSVTVSGSTGAPSNISGAILVDSGLSLQQVYRVWLITYDSSTQILTAIDTLTIPNNNSFGYTPYTFTNVTPGTYRVKAAILNAPAQSTGYVPTYHDSDLLWNNASVINHTSLGSPNVYIYMQKGTPTTGPGFVGGNVTQGANKGTANGIADLPVYIVDMNDQLLSYSVTDGAGSFSFSNLPTGTYKVYPEQLGYTTTPAIITITGTNTTFSNIYFERSHMQKTITPITTGINNVNSIAGSVALYPNPASKEVSIKWDGNESAKVILSDITGKQMIADGINANSIKQLDISQLSNGLYFVTIESNGQKVTQKLLIQ